MTTSLMQFHPLADILRPIPIAQLSHERLRAKLNGILRTAQRTRVNAIIAPIGEPVGSPK